MRSIHYLIAVTFLLATASCAPRMTPPGGVAGAPGAAAAVERYLQLAAIQDHVGMGWIFGNASGSIFSQFPRSEVVLRMEALASLLQHDGFVLGNGVPAPGRSGEAVQFDVILTRGRQTYRIPFTTTRGPQDRWFVEQVRVEAVTGR